MALPKRIYLTGFMAAGKSTVGFIVANTLGFGFVDLDEVVAQKAGRSIQQVFAESGEAHFRRLELETLRETSARKNVVVALGGGALVSDEAWDTIDDESLVVYLETDPKVLARRIFYGKVDRPLMMDAAGERVPLLEVEERIREMLLHRAPHYERAHVTIRSGERSVGRTVDALVAAIRRYPDVVIGAR